MRQSLLALILVGWTDNVGACTVSVTCTVDRLDPSVKTTSPLYVPILRFASDTLIFACCVSPPSSVPFIGSTVSQFAPGDADQLPAVPPQLLTFTDCAEGSLLA